MNIQFTVTAVQDALVTGTTAKEETLSVPLSLFPATCAVGNSYWLEVSEQPVQTATPHEILNELLGATS